ncbi:hypothetical protein [Archangium sp.]|uniref:WD40/YVTN/BNR-like repeat-containing protein n=1 Tax=Archangium sp. TaxID=1872627 RepID=UPI002D23A52A|nr:hypothetical protein [Archangium sp.]HYO55124.1 hypothetical protein [Archangium sp.]
MNRLSSPRCRPLLLAFLTLRTVPALAHGGLPETSNITLRRGVPANLFAGTNFGAVMSRDGGRTWRWICPESMGYSDRMPASYLWLSNGDLLAATGAALIRSRDGGCTWEPHGFFVSQGLWPSGLASHPSEESRLWVSTGRPSSPNALYQSDDGGETFTATSLLRSHAVFTSVRVAPSDPRRLYVSGSTPNGLSLFRSDDAGTTWEEIPQPLPMLVRPYDLRLQTVAEGDPDHLWASVSAAQGLTYVLESRDGGRSFQSLLTLDEQLVDMDSSADGRTFWAASLTRLHRGQTGAPAVQLTLPDGNACVHRDGLLLYACGSTWVHNWALARSRDQGRTWERLLSLPDIQGVHTCPAGTPTYDRCWPRWPQLAQMLGASYSFPDAGTPGGSVDAGTPGDSVDAGLSEPTSDTETPGEPPPKHGCTSSGGQLPMASLLAFIALRRWRRCGRTS